MASSTPLERLDSRKWWWESHLNPRNAKWLSSSLDDLDKKTALMMKLIEDDGDTFARKADMYFQRRPELIDQVQEFHRMYRNLAERYEQLTSDLLRNLPDINLHAQVATELESEPSTPRFQFDVKLNRLTTTPRAAGFDFFLRTVPGRSPREVSPLSDFEEPDVHNYPGTPVSHSEEELHEKTIQMDAQLYNVKEKMGMPQQENANLVELQLKIAGYEVEIGNLKMELENVRSLNSTNLQGEQSSDNRSKIDGKEIDVKHRPEVQEDNYSTDIDVTDPEKVKGVFEELKLTKGRLRNLEMQNERLSTENKVAHENIRQLRDQLKEAQNDVAVLRSKLSRWEEKVSRLKGSLINREVEIRELKDIVGDAKLHAEITRLKNEKDRVEDRLKEAEVKCHTLEIQHEGVEKKLIDEIEQLKADITEKRDQLEALKKDLDELKLKCENELKIKVGELQEEVERKNVFILEIEEEKREAIRQLCLSLEHYRKGYEQLREASTSHT